MIQQRHTIGTPAGRIIITASATGASVQVAFFPADNTKAPCGFLIPNASAGIVTLAIEAVATINEESSEPELPAAALTHRDEEGRASALPSDPGRNCGTCDYYAHCGINCGPGLPDWRPKAHVVARRLAAFSAGLRGELPA